MNRAARYRMQITRLALCVTLGWMPALGSAQIQVRPIAPVAPVEPVVIPPSGAMLETSADADSLLSRAREYIDADQYREALLLLQHVTDNFGNLLTTADGLLYVPARQMVEQTLRDLPADGLDEYRLTADGEARGLLKGKPAERVRDVQVLRQVAERYFISSVGDDAAMALAGHLLDQGKHHAARRWLVKVAQDHPDPSVDPAVLQTRLLAASVGMGDTRGASRALNNLQAMPSIEADRLAMLKQYVESVDPQRNEATQDWPMAYGGPTRNHVMPAMGDAGLHFRDRPSPVIDLDLWVVAWSDRMRIDRNTLTSAETGYYGAQYPTTRPMLIKRWIERGWQPTGRATISDGIAVYKIGETITAIDTRTGTQLWRQTGEGRVPQPSHLNRYYHQQRAATPYPVGLEEMVLFGDRVGRAMSIIDGVVYHVTDSSPVIGLRNRRVRIINGQRVTSNGGSALQAIELKTGKVLWEAEIASRSSWTELGEEQPGQRPATDPGHPRARWSHSRCRPAGRAGRRRRRVVPGRP
jgi:hypothetical protein